MQDWPVAILLLSIGGDKYEETATRLLAYRLLLDSRVESWTDHFEPSRRRYPKHLIDSFNLMALNKLWGVGGLPSRCAMDRHRQRTLFQYDLLISPRTPMKGIAFSLMREHGMKWAALASEAHAGTVIILGVLEPRPSSPGRGIY